MKILRLLRNVTLTLGVAAVLVSVEAGVIWAIGESWRSGQWIFSLGFGGAGLGLIGALCALLHAVDEGGDDS